MEKYKIGIVPCQAGDDVMAMIIATLEEPQMTDLLVPVLYADRNQLEQLRANRNSDARFVYLTRAEDAQEECVCVVDTAVISSSGPAGEKQPVTVWMDDLRSGAIDALVYVGDTETFALPGKAKVTICLSDGGCMALLDRDHLTEDMEHVVAVLERDLGCIKPRMAVVADTDRQKEEWEHKAEEMGAFVYGPFLTDTFFEEEQHKNYDVLMALDAKSASREFRDAARTWVVCLTEDDGQRIALYPAYNSHPMGEDSTAFNMMSLNHALYWASDILRNRRNYDEAHEAPLQKLFFEKKDERKGNIE
ncbi:MAG: hypothetical protein ACI4B5_01860 [Bacteroidaceae bacterium]